LNLMSSCSNFSNSVLNSPSVSHVLHMLWIQTRLWFCLRHCHLSSSSHNSTTIIVSSSTMTGWWIYRHTNKLWQDCCTQHNSHTCKENAKACDDVPQCARIRKRAEPCRAVACCSVSIP
jgi:hypothetical protein